MAEHLDTTKDLLVAAARLRYAPETAQKCVLLQHRLQGVEPESAVAAASLEAVVAILLAAEQVRASAAAPHPPNPPSSHPLPSLLTSLTLAP